MKPPRKRAGRDAPKTGPKRDDRAPLPRHGRPPQKRDDARGPKRDDRGPPTRPGRPPQIRDDARSPKRDDARSPKRDDDRAPKRDDDRAPKRDDARSPKRDDARSPKRDDAREPAKPGFHGSKSDDAHGSRNSDRGANRGDARGSPRDDRGAGRNDRAPMRPPERKDPHAPQEFFVDGLSALSEYARFKPQALLSVEASAPHRAAAERLLREHGVQMPVTELPSRATHETEFAPVRARVRIQALDAEGFEERLEGREHDLILALDHITDPRNLGAVVRSAAFFGVRDVVAPERRQVLFTQASVATAQGGFALTELVCVVNLSRALDALKARGYWIIGTAMDGEPYTNVVGKYEKMVLVLGSEDAGMAQKVRERCDLVVSIPNKGLGLESLNVSVAAGIFLSALAP